jgi:hypothetical protein
MRALHILVVPAGRHMAVGLLREILEGEMMSGEGNAPGIASKPSAY